MNDTTTNKDNGGEHINGERPRVVERQPLTLEKRLGTALANGSASADDLRQLINECEATIAEADREATRCHNDSLSLDCTDPVGAKDAERLAMLTRQRLELVLPKLEAKLATVVRDEIRERWLADRARVNVMLDNAARRFTKYSELVNELVDIFSEAAKVDAEVDRINASSPTGSNHLSHTELHARGLSAFSRSQPPITRNVALPDWRDSERMAWPPRPRSLGLLVTEAMPPAFDPRYSADWGNKEVQDARVAAQNAERERVRDYYETQQKNKEEREARERQQS